jgi:hypothetical protein
VYSAFSSIAVVFRGRQAGAGNGLFIFQNLVPKTNFW